LADIFWQEHVKWVGRGRALTIWHFKLCKIYHQYKIQWHTLCMLPEIC